MARASFVVGFVTGAAAVIFGFAALGLRASTSDADVHDAAVAAQVDEQDLRGALSSLEVAGKPTDPYSYLRSVGELAPVAKSGASLQPAGVGNAISARVACLEAKESGGANVANRRGSGAVGVLQYLPSTFAAHALEMGHPEWSPWNVEQARLVAAHDLALGRRSQWSVGGC